VDGLLAGRYRLLDRLGAGGMSVVWRAHDQVLDRTVAVKVLSPGPSANPELLDRLRIEARSAARLRHPNIVEVYDFGETAQHMPYVVLELVDGRSLAEVLSGGALPWRYATLIGAQVAAALAAAHAHGIVHRDVKPSNVMVTTDGVKLVDFGISATVGEADGIGGEVYGTPAYLAPERLGGGIVRPATDVYALGLLLYLALAGHLPWEASTTTQMLKAHRYLDPAGLPPIAGLPREVADLCRRCLSKHPAGRPSAAAAARILGDVAGLVPATDLLAALDAPTAVIAAPSRRRRPLVAAAAAALLTIAGGAVWFGGRSGPGEVEALPATASPVVTCTVKYAIRSATDGRVSTAVDVTGTGAGKWQLSFALPQGQKLLRGWSHRWAQNGQSVQVTGTALPVATGFDSSYRTATTLPAQFRLNGTVCQAQMSVAGRTAPPATAAAKPGPVAKVPAKPAVKAPAKPAAPKEKKTKAPKVKTKAKAKAKAKVKVKV
jgi:serine/threonine-protein kinase